MGIKGLGYLHHVLLVAHVLPALGERHLLGTARFAVALRLRGVD